jgi:hypothetical protein
MYKNIWNAKKVIRSVAGVSSRTYCRQIFKELNSLTLVSLYIYIYIRNNLFYKKILSGFSAKF